MDEVNRQRGTVKWFDESKGYGFILPDDREAVPDLEPGRDLFVHSRNVDRETAPVASPLLFEGDRVDFIVVKGHKGPAAVDVKVLPR